jgi:O-antigen/teichoic acid export membrane protein
MGERENSKRLAKNTLFLYIRLLFSMVITLYTSRVILKYLGVEDFGIYNVIGGLVSMFSIISGSLSTAVSRHMTFELGRGDINMLKKTFVMSVNVQILISIICVFFAEIIGVWFLNTQMNIPDNRMWAANWVLQLSIFTFVVNLLSVPYNASLISHEHMKAFAYIGIFEVVMKLLVVYMLICNPIDKLVYYSLLLLCLAFLIQFIYVIYCKKHFFECNYHYFFDKAIMIKLFSFAGWGFIGASSGILRSHGVNLLLNIFFGPAINAARGIANQVNNALNGFVGNFMTALTPQITKAYAQKNYSYLLNCVYKGSKFSFFLIYLLSLPVLLRTEWILKVWLTTVPPTTVAFVQLMLIFSMVDTLSRTMINANNATGDIKYYQIVVGSLNLLVLPLSYIALKMGASPETTVVISVIVSLLGIVPRIYFNKKHFPIRYKDFFTNVVVPVIAVVLTSIIFPYIASSYLNQNALNFLFVTCICFINTGISILYLGCNKHERQYAILFVKKKFIH